MKFIGSTNEYLHLATVTTQNRNVLKETIESSLTILWFDSGHNELVIDGKQQVLVHQLLQITRLSAFDRIP